MKIIQTIQEKLWNIVHKTKEKKCPHDDFWSLYKILNFNRRSMKWICWKCEEEITLKYLWYDALNRNLWVATFSCVLWMSPAFLIIALASIYGEVSGYIIAIVAVIAFHFWAMYYVIRGWLVEVTTKK